MRHKYDLDDKIVIGHIGNYTAHKNQDFMLKIFSNIVSVNPNVHLIWGGGVSDAELHHIEEIIDKYRINGHITLLGVCNNVNEWI